VDSHPGRPASRWKPCWPTSSSVRAARQAAFDAEGERLQAEIDACTVTMLACQGRLQ